MNRALCAVLAACWGAASATAAYAGAWGWATLMGVGAGLWLGAAIGRRE